MLFSPLLQGIVIGGSMIIPIGAQNSYILGQGIKRNHHILAATICMVCDVLLIGLGIFGGGQLIATNEWLLLLITWGGILFLLTYGFLSFRTAWQNNYLGFGSTKGLLKRKTVIGTTLAVTLLNPHVYLDTVMILGSVGGQFQGNEKLAFATGTMLASLIWFYSLATGAAKMAPWLAKPTVQRVIDIIVGIVMWLVAASLFNHSF